MTMLLVICIAAVSAAGCMSPPPLSAGATTQLTPVPQETPSAALSPLPAGECTRPADCVPAECCHPSRCIPITAKHPCNLLCTAICEGPLDCGAGSCGCMNGTCSVVPASPPVSDNLRNSTMITIRASPQRYSPIMSSTPGIGLEPVVTGFSLENASFAWKTNYGQFLSWNSPDYRVNQLGDSPSNHGEKLFWSFSDTPSSTAIPVTITVTATEKESGHVLGSAKVTLAWEGNYTVTVQETG